jgi:hypothetical protein
MSMLKPDVTPYPSVTGKWSVPEPRVCCLCWGGFQRASAAGLHGAIGDAIHLAKLSALQPNGTKVLRAGRVAAATAARITSLVMHPLQAWVVGAAPIVIH